MATQSIPAPLELTAQGGSGEVYEHGAHLASWVPADHDPVIWMSALARFEPSVAIRGGVPIIFPWFGSGRSGQLNPAHGFARTRQWQLLSQGNEGGDAVASFALDGAAASEPNFPYAFAARYVIRLGSTLQLHLTVENTGEVPFSFEEALHTYFRVGDVRQIRVEGLDGCTYLDQADPSGLVARQQAGDVTFTGETDRIYASSDPVRLVDPVLGRTLTIEKQHSASTVVWNPWIQKAGRMGDFGDDEWTSMVCIEGGNLRDSAVELQPGQAHEMRYTVRVARI